MVNGSYIMITAWMRNELELRGNDLMVYALIYGFSQDGESVFRGNTQYIADWIGASKVTVLKILKSLTDRGLLEKIEVPVATNLHLTHYKAISPVKNPGTEDADLTAGKETLPPVKNEEGAVKKLNEAVKKLNRGGKETLPIYTNNNTNNNTNKNNNGNRFTPPTLEEVKAYCLERGNGIDPQQFIDHYESNGWMVGKNKMKNWKAAIGTWERNEFSQQRQPKKEEKPKTKFNNFPERSYDFESYEAALLSRGMVPPA